MVARYGKANLVPHTESSILGQEHDARGLERPVRWQLYASMIHSALQLRQRGLRAEG